MSNSRWAIIAVVLVIIIGVGYAVYQRNNTTAMNDTYNSVTPASGTATTPGAYTDTATAPSPTEPASTGMGGPAVVSDTGTLSPTAP